MKAQCSCGSLSADIPDTPEKVTACHCIACQRRTGSVFGVTAAFAADDVTVSGASSIYERPTASGGTMRAHFCPACGTTLYWQSHKFPHLIGVAMGCIADPGYPAPERSVWEESKHHWVDINSAEEHFPQGKHNRG